MTGIAERPVGRLVQPGKESEDKNSQLVLGMVWEPVSFNPLRGIDSGSYCASSLVYEGLVKFDENLDLVGGLAESFSVSQDGLTYRFRLRPNLRYSDGEKIEAADIKASLLLGASSISPFRSDYKDMKEVVIEDERNLVVVLERPCQPLLSRMAELRILPTHILQSADHGNKRLGRSPICTGAYQLKRWKAGQELVFERNPYYWGKPAETASIIWRVIPDKMALSAALARGEVDLAPVDGRLWQNFLSKSKEHLAMAEFNGGRTVYLGFNLQKAPWNNLKVRQAFASAINRGAMVDAFYSGHAVVPNTDVPLTSWAFEPNLPRADFAPEKVPALLQEAGFKKEGKAWLKDGKVLALRILTIKDFEEMAQAVADYLRRVDIPAEVEVMEYSTLRRAFMQKGLFDVILWSRSFGPDPECSMVWSSGGALNFCRLQDARVDGWLREARLAPNRQARKAIYRKFQEYLATELPWLFLAQPRQIMAYREGMVGIQKGRQKDAGLPWDNIAANAAFWKHR